MGTLILALLIGLMIACLAVGCGDNQENSPSSSNSSASKITMLSHEELGRRLNKLASMRVSDKPRANNAMCYDIHMPPDRFDYVCQACGERTAYARRSDQPDSQSEILNDNNMLCVEGIVWIRRSLSDLRKLGLDATFDESEFCRKCKPNVKDPQLYFDIKVEDFAAPVRSKGLCLSDLTILKAFLEGNLASRREEDKAFLQKELPRLRELLGIQKQDDAKK